MCCWGCTCVSVRQVCVNHFATEKVVWDERNLRKVKFMVTNIHYSGSRLFPDDNYLWYWIVGTKLELWLSSKCVSVSSLPRENTLRWHKFALCWSSPYPTAIILVVGFSLMAIKSVSQARKCDSGISTPTNTLIYIQLLHFYVTRRIWTHYSPYKPIDKLLYFKTLLDRVEFTSILMWRKLIISVLFIICRTSRCNVYV